LTHLDSAGSHNTLELGSRVTLVMNRTSFHLAFSFHFSAFNNMEYTVPIKRIVTKEDLEDFLTSGAYNEYIGYIERLNDSIKNCKIDSDVQVSKVSSSRHIYCCAQNTDRWCVTECANSA